MHIQTFLDCVYQGNSVEDITRRYIKALESCPSTRNTLHALALKRYLNYRRNQKFIDKFKMEIETIDSILDLNYPKLHRKIKGRFKSLVSFENKTIRKLDAEESIDTLQDILAYRIIIDQEDCSPKELVELCYSVGNDIITFYLTKGYYLCVAEPVIDTIESDSPRLSEIIVPEASRIDPLYSSGCKDYILFPKCNGYQSLHLQFRTPFGFTFEVQIRTSQMDHYAEEGYADHITYKEAKYPNTVSFDRTKVNIEGYSINTDTGEITDLVGLEFPELLFSK